LFFSLLFFYFLSPSGLFKKFNSSKSPIKQFESGREEREKKKERG